MSASHGLADRLVKLQRSRPADPRALSAQAAAGARYAGGLRQTRIRARTLVMQGTADTVVDPRNGKLLGDRIPGAQLMLFPDLGHLLFWQDPDGFATAVISFLRSTGRNEGNQSAAAPATRSCGNEATMTTQGIGAP